VSIEVAVGVISGDGVGVGGADVAVGETGAAVGRIGVPVAAGGVDVATGGRGVLLAGRAIEVPVPGTGVVVDPAGLQPVANTPRSASSPSALPRADMIASCRPPGRWPWKRPATQLLKRHPLTLSSHI